MQTNISVDITNASVKYQLLEFDSLRNGMGLTQDAELGTALLGAGRVGGLADNLSSVRLPKID